jgi:hypothetical protein
MLFVRSLAVVHLPMNALDGLFIQFLWNQLFRGNASQPGQMQKTMPINICDEILTRNIALPF